ncbi:hypothetical protein CDL12_06810 [Handroanthus impetiginosus]|uniref:Ycf2 N-terminal domain-containing protein n=1 Tax=Handroanthus impetiginosus TaxID=429701 RepID=A0A2G9HSK7_9LAMI|nr:hypothetical protein CDL12_06810 [Handroanthus impetiginosus]
MTSADFTLSTPGATPLAVLPPRRRTGARVEPLISGVRAVERNKILRPPNIGAGGTARINNYDFTYGQFLNILFIRNKIFIFPY